MARRIVLHIGAPKAGSTFLQRALLANRDRLAARGIAYPHPGEGHPGNARGIAQLDEAGFEALFAGGAETVVLSHEDLFAIEQEAKPLSRLARAAGVPVQKLVFLRPWSAFCAGDFSQHLKQNFEAYLAARRAFDGRTFEEMAARRAAGIDPVAIFLRWARVVPLPPLVLAPHGAIAATVEALLGAPGLDWAVPGHLTNPSLRVADCEAIAAMIDDPGVPGEAVRAAFDAAHHRTADPDPGRNPDRMARIEAMFDRQNAGLLAVYGYDNRLKSNGIQS